MSPEQTFGYLIRDVSILWRSIIDRRLEPLGLSASRWEPLVALLRAPAPMTQAMLAETLNIEAPSVVRLMDRLDRDGWIQRLQSPVDRRAYHVVLTAKARKACIEIERVLSDTRREILGVLDKDEIPACIDALERVRTQALQVRDSDSKAQLPKPPAPRSGRG